MSARAERRRQTIASLAGRCPRCAAAHGARQRFCLECGLALPVQQGALPALRRAWIGRLGWYPGDFVWRPLVALLLAVAGGVVASRLVEARADSHPHALVAATPATVLETTPGTETDGSVRWPALAQGWTVVLMSSPLAAGRASARTLAAHAVHQGLTQVGVLDSSAFPSLPPGYAIVFSGVYATSAQAAVALRSVQARGFAGAYTVQVTP